LFSAVARLRVGCFLLVEPVVECWLILL